MQIPAALPRRCRSTPCLPRELADASCSTERQSLLNAGIATSVVSGGVLRVERAITTYQRNAFAQADASYLDSETLHQLTEVTRRLRARITNKYPRHKLANDNTRFGAGQAIVTPSVIRGELIAEYADMEDAGLVENMDLFKKYLIVERNATNPNRLDVLLPPDLVNQLRVFAVLNQFRLQYPQRRKVTQGPPCNQLLRKSQHAIETPLQAPATSR